MSVTMWFESYWPGLKSEVGGKAASLGEMTGVGLPVPPGYAVTTAGYRAAHDAADLDATLARLLHGLDTSDTAQVSTVCAEIRDVIRTMPLPAHVEERIRLDYEQLCRKCEVDSLPVAVRSSATSEDSPDASFAGEHDTYLWIRGDDAVVDAVRRCWASLFTDRATCYRVEMGYEHRSVDMAVVIQKMVRPIAAGVAFTLNPANGDRSQVAIDAAWGFGEGVVSGEVTPDNFLIDKVLLEVTKRDISNKAHEYRLTDHDSVEKATIDDDRAEKPCMTDVQLKAVASLAKTAERHYGCPQDIEWAVDADLPEGENIILLQARPETVWSKKPRESVTGGAAKDPMASIVSTLMNPLYTKKQ
ncbi:MAG: phosphoenolpyruvate synthase [Actinobacteria bacterium]|nr:phosphoenolpyruvate synthase [Actinomycetota bacterium]